MNTQNSHLEIKTKLAGSQTLEEEMSLKEKTDPKLLGSFDKLCALPWDIATLSVSNDCIISDYVDFHSTNKVNNAKANYQELISSLGKLF